MFFKVFQCFLRFLAKNCQNKKKPGNPRKVNLQLGGYISGVRFAILVFGQLVYDAIIKLPGIDYDEDADAMAVSAALASPLLSYASRMDGGISMCLFLSF